MRLIHQKRERQRLPRFLDGAGGTGGSRNHVEKGLELVAVCFAIALLKAIDEDGAMKASRIGDERAPVKAVR